MSHLVSFRWIRKTQVIPEYGGFYKEVGRLWEMCILFLIHHPLASISFFCSFKFSPPIVFLSFSSFCPSLHQMNLFESFCKSYPSISNHFPHHGSSLFSIFPPSYIPYTVRGSIPSIHFLENFSGCT